MFTLYEVAFKGTKDRLFLTASKEEAIKRRGELRAEYAAAGSKEVIVARRVITPDYWICEGTVFEDIADLYEAYPESDATVIHMTTASQETYRYAHGHNASLAAEAAEAATKQHDPARPGTRYLLILSSHARRLKSRKGTSSSSSSWTDSGSAPPDQQEGQQMIRIGFRQNERLRQNGSGGED